MISETASGFSYFLMISVEYGLISAVFPKAEIITVCSDSLMISNSFTSEQ